MESGQAGTQENQSCDCRFRGQQGADAEGSLQETTGALRSVMSRLDQVQMNEQEQILDGVVSVREVLNFIESDRYLDLKEVTEYLPLSERTIREHLNEIPHFRYGKKIIFRKSELDQWMEKFRVKDQDLDQAMKMAEEMLG